MDLDPKAICSVKGVVSGRVQGVGFRYFVMCQARSEELFGYVRNLNDGRVEFLLQGPSDAVTRVTEQIHRGPEHSRVLDVSIETLKQTETFSNFRIS